MMMVRTTGAITHIHAERGFTSMAYINDFGGAEKGEARAEEALGTLQNIFRDLGVEEASAKVCLPSQIMT